MALLIGCRLTRPPQENFVLHTGVTGAEPFVAALSDKLQTTAESRLIDIPDGEPMQTFGLKGAGVEIDITAMPNDRCNPNGPRHVSWRKDEFRIDLVYATFSLFGQRDASVMQRRAARKMLFKMAEEVGHELTPFEDC